VMSDRELERGPQGDHGQAGTPGAQGEKGEGWHWRGLATLRLLAYVGVVTALAYSVFGAELRTCHRVQYLRDQANGTNFLVYDTFKSVRDQQQAAINSGKLKGKALQQAREAVGRADKVVKTTVVTGPTDCEAATFNPSYAAPAPEFIDKNNAQVKRARMHSADIVRKAKLREPLYKG
jgi:hypothetical protein